ncbi:hypothetical protein DRP53_00435 [candidate division WOR-3 bacterium]|uniref:TonB-dependent receptor n=1 Tax=candidate division WOR-3 bacterium TaxID=2052148 RepID=A0A660SM01_UNCW3|nr:MAG: hypothetical protein DRP53_00435 [candidate division WOR-3 bacterium]
MFGLIIILLAFPDTLKVYKLEEIVVTATRSERAIKDLSATVSVLTEEEISSRYVHTTPDLLSFLPGVFIEKTGSFGRSDIDIRGLGDRGRKVMVLVDGRPVKMGLFGCTVTHSLPLNNVERIEVVRGPASVLYGSDALGGVVNIITKRVESGFTTDLRLAYGSYQTQQLRLRHGGRIGEFDYFLTGDYEKSDGHLENSAYSGKDFTGRIGYQLLPGLRASLSAKYFDGYKEEPKRVTDPETLESDVWNRYRRGAIDLSIDGRWQRYRGMIKSYLNFGRHEFSDGWKSKDSTYGMIGHLTGRITNTNELMVGVEYRRQLGEWIGTGSWSKYEIGIFAHDEQRILNKLIATVGGRINWDEISGRVFVPRAGLVWPILSGTIIRGSIGRGFRSPQLNELYMFPPSNPDLKAEFVTNYEVGISQHLFGPLSFDLVGFLMDGENLIELAPNPSPPPKFRFQNTDSFRFYGSEISLRIDHRKLKGEINYSHLDPGEKTRGRIKDKFGISLSGDFQPIRIGLMGQYVTNYFAADSSMDRIDDYLLINLNLSFRFGFGLVPFLSIENILDQEYAIYADLPGGAAGCYEMPGRSFTIGLDFRW